MTKEELIEQMAKKYCPYSLAVQLTFTEGIESALSNPPLLKAAGYIPESEVQGMIEQAIEKIKKPYSPSPKRIV